MTSSEGDCSTHLSVNHPDDWEAQHRARQDVLPVVMVVGGSAQGDGQGDQEEDQGKQQPPGRDWSTAVESSQFSRDIEEYKSPGGKREWRMTTGKGLPSLYDCTDISGAF